MGSETTEKMRATSISFIDMKHVFIAGTWTEISWLMFRRVTEGDSQIGVVGELENEKRR